MQRGCRYNGLLLGIVMFPSMMDVSLQEVAVVIGNCSVPIYDGCLSICRVLPLQLGTVLFPPMMDVRCLSACRCSAG